MYYSQAGQDKWVHELIGNKGFFVDVGAYDGIQTSNTYALELVGWSGICIEANPVLWEQLTTNRKCIIISKAVTDYKGVCQFGIDRIGGDHQINCDTLNNMLAYLEILSGRKLLPIDYMSLDIEGHELKALSAFDFDHYPVKLITVEHNLYLDGPEKKDALFKLLTEKGFTRVVEDVKCLDTNPLYFNQPFEDWYMKNET